MSATNGSLLMQAVRGNSFVGATGEISFSSNDRGLFVLFLFFILLFHIPN
jgi:hypothetical protein